MYKATSEPILKHKKYRSCLKPGKFATTPPAKVERSQSDSSVSFKAVVDIVVYEKPKEHWAADGWSSYFA